MRAIIVLAVLGILAVPAWAQTPTDTPVNTGTPTFTPVNTNTPTNTLTSTPTRTPTQTNTPTRTLTNTPINTDTPRFSPTFTRTPTNTPTSVNTPTRTRTNTRTPTNTQTPTRTNTPLNTPTPTLTFTPGFKPVVDVSQTDNASLENVSCGSPPCAGKYVPGSKGFMTASCTTYNGGTVTVQVYCLAHTGYWQGTPIPVQTPFTCPGFVGFHANFDQCREVVTTAIPGATPTGTPAAAQTPRVGGWIDREAPPGAIWWSH